MNPAGPPVAPRSSPAAGRGGLSLPILKHGVWLARHKPLCLWDAALSSARELRSGYGPAAAPPCGPPPPATACPPTPLHCIAAANACAAHEGVEGEGEAVEAVVRPA